MNFRKTAVFLLLLISILSMPAPTFAISEEEKTFLSMYFKDEELVVLSATRSLKSITRVAENVEIITAEDIELMNAHNLADVLKTVNGVQIYMAGGSPGSISMPIIQSSDIRQVAVFIDGVWFNFLSSEVPDIANIPVQIVEKIEIIKGPASSVWGSSLGGIINIITKSLGNKDKISGAISASYGERATGDFRAELYGKKNKFGYYLYAGRLQTDGFRPNEDFFNNNLYAKLTYDITKDTGILFTFLYTKGDRGEGEDNIWDGTFSDRSRYLLSTLTLNSALSNDISLNIALRAARQIYHMKGKTLSTGEELYNDIEDDRKLGASAKLTWKTGNHNIVFGSDYDDYTLKSNIYAKDTYTKEKWAVFVNDTISFGKFTVIPGLRYDHADINESFISPSLGMTYEIGTKTLVRAYIARGFSDPDMASFTDSLWYSRNPDIEPERVWSYQIGAETGVLEYLWMKIAAFRHEIKDGIVYEDLPDGRFTVVNKDHIRRQGIEIAFKTRPVYHFTLFGSSSFISIKNRDTDEEIKDIPTNTYDIGLKYDNEKSFRALLTGHYVWWNSILDKKAKYASMIFDANIIKEILKQKDSSLELYLTGHNIFNGSQYHAAAFKNAQRWFEAGVRYKF